MLRNTIRNLLSLIGIGILGVSCNHNSEPSDGDPCDPPPPPPPSNDHEEQEPNDELEEAQFLAILPINSQQNLLGSFWLPQDVDCYSFFIAPALGATSVEFNFMLECDPFVNPKVRLWQTTIDSQGTPTGHQLLGTWVADDGKLVVVDERIPYDEFFNNDLIMQIIPWGGLADPPPDTDLTYVLDFWSS